MSLRFSWLAYVLLQTKHKRVPQFQMGIFQNYMYNIIFKENETQK